MVTRNLVRAIAHQMKKGGFPALQTILTEVRRALSTMRAARGDLFESSDVTRLEFYRNIEAISARHAFSRSTQMLCAVAGQVFEQQQGNATVSQDAVNSAFARSLATKLTDYHLLAVAVDDTTVRLQLMRENGRDAIAQQEFEQDVIMQSVPAISALIQQASKSPDGIPTRTPRLPKPADVFSMEELHATLP